MNTFTSLLRQCLLAIALAGTALGAAADPISYRVTVNTAGLETGVYLDFLFTQLNAAPVTAKVTNLTGATGSLGGFSGANVNLDGSFTIDNDAEAINYVDFFASFGGAFMFDVMFSDGFEGDAANAGSRFSVSVLDADFAPITGGADLVLFDLSANGIVASWLPGNSAELIAATAVPEPSSMLMMMTGLGLVGFTARRRKSLSKEAATA
jgi:hypothetical protein